MPHTKETTVYTFDELSDQAKVRARDWYRDGMEAYEYSEYVIEDAVRLGQLIGIEIDTHAVTLMGGGTRQEPSVYWALHVQGAGASFDGRYAYRKGSVKAIATEAPPVDDGNREINRIAKELAARQRSAGYRLSARIKAGREVHEYAAQIDVFKGEDDAPDYDAEDVSDLLRAFMRWLHDGLEREYEYRTSDAAVDETIRANEYEFDADGDRT